MPGAARLRCKHSDTLSVLDSYGLSPERIRVRFGDDGEGWRTMRKRLFAFESTRASLLVKTGAFYAAMRQTAPVIDHPLRSESRKDAQIIMYAL
jgi:hypothetical protein